MLHCKALWLVLVFTGLFAAVWKSNEPRAARAAQQQNTPASPLKLIEIAASARSLSQPVQNCAQRRPEEEQAEIEQGCPYSCIVLAVTCVQGQGKAARLHV